MCAALINFSTRRHENTSWQSSDKKFVHFYKKLSIFLHSLIVSILKVGTRAFFSTALLESQGYFLQLNILRQILQSVLAAETCALIH